MPYIDKDKLNRRLPCYFEDTGEEALVPVSAVSHMLAVATVENVAPVEEVIAKVREGIGRNIFNPNNKFDFIYDEIYKVLNDVLEEYNAKKDT